MNKNLYIPLDTTIDDIFECERLVKRGDTLTLTIKVFDDGELAKLTDQSVDLILKKPDGTLIENTIDVSNISNGVITVQPIQQSTLISGTVQGELQLYTTGTLSSSNTFTFVVSESLADNVIEISKHDINILNDLRDLIATGQAAIEEYKDNILAIGNTVEAIEALANIKSYIDTNLIALQGQNAQAVVNIANETNANNAAVQNISELTIKNNSANQNKSDLDSKNATASSNISALNSKNATASSNISALDSKNSTASTNINNLDTKNGIANINLTNLDSENDRAETNIQALENLGDATTLLQDTTSIKNEIQTARGGKPNLDARLDDFDSSLSQKVQKDDFTSFTKIPYSPMPSKQGTKTNTPKIIHKIQDDYFRIIQKTNKGYIAYALNTLNGDTGDTSVGGHWELIRLKRVDVVPIAYVWWFNNPTTGTITVQDAPTTNGIPEQQLFGVNSSLTDTRSSDGTGYGFGRYSIAPSSSATFTIKNSYKSKMNMLFLSSNLSSSSVDIIINGVTVKNFNARAYRLSTGGNYSLIEFDTSKHYNNSLTYDITIQNNDATNPFYFCCFNLFELKDYEGQTVNNYKMFKNGSSHINNEGSSDYAIHDNDLNKWCGSFHGGETREYGKVSWKTLDNGLEEVATPTDFSSVTNNDWTIMKDFYVLQKTNINNKAKMVSRFDFNTDGTMEMKFSLNDCTIKADTLYTALTCGGTNFNYISYPDIEPLSLNIDNIYPNVMGEITQYDTTNLLTLNIRFTQFNRYLSTALTKDPFIRYNSNYAKFYYGVIVDQNTTPQIISNLCFSKGLDFSVL